MTIFHCLLCNNTSSLYYEDKSRKFYKCDFCKSVFVPDKFHLSNEDEINRYRLHNNDVNDSGYREFFSPVAKAITASFDNNSRGLDFGCGTGPVVSAMLGEAGYKTDLYDPCFQNNTAVFSKKYDYIICTEVMEHFKQPAAEFKVLQTMLKPSGKLFCTTAILTPLSDFKAWYYKNDRTHIFFYSPDSIRFIQQNSGFDSVQIENNLIIFTNQETYQPF